MRERRQDRCQDLCKSSVFPQQHQVSRANISRTRPSPQAAASSRARSSSGVLRRNTRTTSRRSKPVRLSPHLLLTAVLLRPTNPKPLRTSPSQLRASARPRSTRLTQRMARSLLRRRLADARRRVRHHLSRSSSRRSRRRRPRRRSRMRWRCKGSQASRWGG
jgi:hypothetical protein